MSQETWREHWGVEYRGDLRNMDLQPIFRDLELDGMLGETILDIGSGYYPVSEYLSKNHRVVTIDIEGQEGEQQGHFHIRHDVELLTDEHRYTSQKAFVQMAQYFNIDIRGSTKENVDTMIFSQLLNYVDFRKVLSVASTYLRPGGLFVIVNQPNFGYSDMFSEGGVKNNAELLEEMLRNEFEIITKVFPWIKKGSEPISTSMMIVVGRKQTETNINKKQVLSRKDRWRLAYTNLVVKKLACRKYE